MTTAVVLLGLPIALAVLAPLVGADSRDHRWSLTRRADRRAPRTDRRA